MAKKCLFLLLLLPFLLTIGFVVQIRKIDTDLTHTTVVPLNNNGSLLSIDKHASKRRIYFFVSEAGKIIKYERKYRGFVTDWWVKSQATKFANNKMLSFYHEHNPQSGQAESFPFFGLYKEKKDFSYYADIYYYLKEKYFFMLLAAFIGFILGGAWSIDTIGGATHNKGIFACFLLELVYLAILLFF